MNRRHRNADNLNFFTRDARRNFLQVVFVKNLKVQVQEKNEDNSLVMSNRKQNNRVPIDQVNVGRCKLVDIKGYANWAIQASIYYLVLRHSSLMSLHRSIKCHPDALLEQNGNNDDHSGAMSSRVRNHLLFSHALSPLSTHFVWDLSVNSSTTE